MHTVHLPEVEFNGTVLNNGYIAAALGVIFDTKKYSEYITESQVETIDRFFDSLFENMDTSTLDLNPSDVLYGNLIQSLDTDRRWV